MEKIILLLSMIFCHLLDDYKIQGILADFKQESWWEKNCPGKFYKYDYKIALAEHAFSWTFMIHIPIVIFIYLSNITINDYLIILFVVFFIVNWIIHYYIDDAKANLKIINLVIDQLIHVIQIIFTWLLYIIL